MSAQILDLIEDDYIFMYVCNEGDDGQTHAQNGIIFTRQIKVTNLRMNLYLKRAAAVMAANNLKHIVMESIPLDSCDMPKLHGN